MSTVLGSNKGTGNGWAATLKDAQTDHDQIEVTMFGDPDRIYVRGRIKGWTLPDGTYLSTEDAAMKGIR